MGKWRAQIGLIGPIESLTEGAFHRYAPVNVNFSTTRIQMRDITVDGLIDFVDRMEVAAAVYKGYPQDIIIFGCTAASCIKGPGWDKECSRRITKASGSPGTTTSTAVLESFAALNVSKVAMLTPYSKEVTEIEKNFLEGSGICITTATTMDTSRFNGDVDEGFIYKQAKSMNLDGTEALFISCMALETMQLIEVLETDLGLPVITSHQASLWSVLRRAGVRENISGIGKLFSF